jgi:hypothetical protein
MDLHYGNLSREFLPYLEKKNIFTNYLNEFLTTPYPNYFESMKECKLIMKHQEDAMNSKDWNSILSFCSHWDSELIGSLKMSLKKLDIPFNDEYIEYLTDISEDLGALILQLKSKYQRARPYQVAYYSNMKLHPFETLSGNTPSYPSGHASQGYFLCSVIAHHYPEKKEELMKLASRIAESRIIWGIHFPSDNAFGIHIAKQLMAKDDIKEMYFGGGGDDDVANV